MRRIRVKKLINAFKNKFIDAPTRNQLKLMKKIWMNKIPQFGGTVHRCNNIINIKQYLTPKQIKRYAKENN